jgi:pyridoxine 4-dehydrogenase
MAGHYHELSYIKQLPGWCRLKLKAMQGIFYGTPTANSLHLLRYYFKKYPEDADKVVLSIKGAYDRAKGPTGSREEIRASVEGALKVLEGTKTIDVFEMG